MKAKLVLVVLLVSLLVIQDIEAWPRISVPRISVPRISIPRISIPRISLPRIRVPTIPPVRFPITLPTLSPKWRDIADKVCNICPCNYKTICCVPTLFSSSKLLPGICPKWELDPDIQNQESMKDSQQDPCPQRCKNCNLNSLYSEECEDCIDICHCVGLEDPSNINSVNPTQGACPKWEIKPRMYKEIEENFCPEMCKACQTGSSNETECELCMKYCHCPALEMMSHPKLHHFSVEMCQKWDLTLESSQSMEEYFCPDVCYGCQENSQNKLKCEICDEFCHCTRKAESSSAEVQNCQWEVNPAKIGDLDPEDLKEYPCPEECKECDLGSMEAKECKACTAYCHCVSREVPSSEQEEVKEEKVSRDEVEEEEKERQEEEEEKEEGEEKEE